MDRKIMDYDFVVQYIRGDTMGLADELSRESLMMKMLNKER